MFFSAFATVAHGFFSVLCCGTYSFRGSQQFSLSPYGLSPYALRQLLVRRGLLLPLRFRARIVVAVTLHEVNHAPDTKPGSKCYNKGLQNVYCAIEKCHKYILSAASAAVRQADKRRSAYAAAQKNRPLVKAAVPALRKFCGAAVFSCKGCGSCRCVLRRKVGARIM